MRAISESIAEALRRRGLAAPARLVLDAHRPLRPLLAETGVFLSPVLRPLFGRRYGTCKNSWNGTQLTTS